MNNFMVHTMHKQMQTFVHAPACMQVQSPLKKHAVQIIRKRPRLHTVRDQIYATKQSVFIYSTSEKYTSCKQYQ
jgi:hypothetical protein